LQGEGEAGDQGCHLGQGIEPFGDLFAFGAIFQAAVDLLRMGCGSRAILPFLVIKKYFFWLHSPSFTFIDLHFDLH
jgi:hypothetical protein